MSKDAINPGHYTSHPSGVECIQITEHMDFCLGNALKYIWRAGQKGDAVEDLEKAAWYIRRKIKLLKIEERGAIFEKTKPVDDADLVKDINEIQAEYTKGAGDAT